MYLSHSITLIYKILGVYDNSIEFFLPLDLSSNFLQISFMFEHNIPKRSVQMNTSLVCYAGLTTIFTILFFITITLTISLPSTYLITCS